MSVLFFSWSVSLFILLVGVWFEGINNLVMLLIFIEVWFQAGSLA